MRAVERKVKKCAHAVSCWVDRVSGAHRIVLSRRRRRRRRLPLRLKVGRCHVGILKQMLRIRRRFALCKKAAGLAFLLHAGKSKTPHLRDAGGLFRRPMLQ